MCLCRIIRKLPEILKEFRENYLIHSLEIKIPAVLVPSLDPGHSPASDIENDSARVSGRNDACLHEDFYYQGFGVHLLTYPMRPNFADWPLNVIAKFFFYRS